MTRQGGDLYDLAEPWLAVKLATYLFAHQTEDDGRSPSSAGLLLATFMFGGFCARYLRGVSFFGG
jgi:hypothetical protein